tara:strand:+ start:194 stop:391 length:198 start_codon:yes stop_codon:yes gene_type:complete
MKSQDKKANSRASMTIKKNYKVSLEQTAAEVSLATGEHIPATEVLYTLIELHIKSAKDHLIKKYS